MEDTMKSIPLTLVIIVLFSGCTKKDNTVNTIQQYSYSIEQSRDCFCPQAGDPVRLFIAADTIADAVWISTNEHLTPAAWQRFRSIKGLVNEVNYWDSSSAFQVKAVYDSVYHYPSYVSITPKPMIINDTLMSIVDDAAVSYRTWNYIKFK
jgi:hypothetical protein